MCEDATAAAVLISLALTSCLLSNFLMEFDRILWMVCVTKLMLTSGIEIGGIFCYRGLADTQVFFLTSVLLVRQRPDMTMLVGKINHFGKSISSQKIGNSFAFVIFCFDSKKNKLLATTF
jgi:hypothetical protein